MIISFDFSKSTKAILHTVTYYSSLSMDYVSNADIAGSPLTTKTVTVIDTGIAQEMTL